jgi:hypothetical protein
VSFFSENNRPGFVYPPARSFSLVSHWLRERVKGIPPIFEPILVGRAYWIVKMGIPVMADRHSI